MPAYQMTTYVCDCCGKSNTDICEDTEVIVRVKQLPSDGTAMAWDKEDNMLYCYDCRQLKRQTTPPTDDDRLFYELMRQIYPNYLCRDDMNKIAHWFAGSRLANAGLYVVMVLESKAPRYGCTNVGYQYSQNEDNIWLHDLPAEYQHALSIEDLLQRDLVVVSSERPKRYEMNRALLMSLAMLPA